MAQYNLSAHVRESHGKSAARKLRKNKQVPAIFYGPETKPVMLAVKQADLHGLLKEAALENVILGLEIESESGKETRNVMVKELQTDPIKDVFYHVDFYEIAMDKEIVIDVPIHLLNTPAGIQKGGVLQHIRREMTISALPGGLLEFVEVDVSGLDVGESVHIEDIHLPEGVTTPLDPHLAVAVVAAPAVSAEKAEEEGEEIEEQGEDAEAQPGQEE